MSVCLLLTGDLCHYCLRNPPVSQERFDLFFHHTAVPPANTQKYHLIHCQQLNLATMLYFTGANIQRTAECLYILWDAVRPSWEMSKRYAAKVKSTTTAIKYILCICYFTISINLHVYFWCELLYHRLPSISDKRWHIRFCCRRCAPARIVWLQ